LRYSVVEAAKEGSAGFVISVQREYPTPGCIYKVHVKFTGELSFSPKKDVACAELAID
jgi:hypothetical protein